MIESLQIAWVGTVIGAVLSLPLGFFGARNVSSGLVSNVIRQLLNAIRAFPEIVLAIAIFIPIAGLGPVAGALAIGAPLGRHARQADRRGRSRASTPGPSRRRAPRAAARSRSSAGASCPRCCPRSSPSGSTASRSTSAPRAVLGVVGAGGIGFVAPADDPVPALRPGGHGDHRGRRRDDRSSTRSRAGSAAGSSRVAEARRIEPARRCAGGPRLRSVALAGRHGRR